MCIRRLFQKKQMTRANEVNYGALIALETVSREERPCHRTCMRCAPLSGHQPFSPEAKNRSASCAGVDGIEENVGDIELRC